MRVARKIEGLFLWLVSNFSTFFETLHVNWLNLINFFLLVTIYSFLCNFTLYAVYRCMKGTNPNFKGKMRSGVFELVSGPSASHFPLNILEIA